MATMASISLDDHVYESAKVCSAALGQSINEWLNEAARVAARRQNAAAYAAWEMSRGPDLDEIDEATAGTSLDRAEWQR
jgi:hypothetical protein